MKTPPVECSPAGRAQGRNVYERAITSSAIYSAAVFAPLAASLVMLPVYMRYLTPADYGIVELLDVARNIFSMLVAGRFAEALFYFNGKATSESDRRNSLTTMFWGAVIVGALSGCLGVLLSREFAKLVFRDAAFTTYFQLMFVALGLTFPVEAMLAIYRAEGRAIAYVAASICRVCVTVAVTYTFVVVFRARVSGLLWSAVISSIVMAIALTVSYILRKPGAFVPALFRQMLAFSMPLGLSGIALLIVHSGDRFFLQRYGDLNALGIYGLAYKLGMMISYLQASFGTYWTANMYKVLDGEGTQKIFERINTYQMLATTYGALIVIAFSSPFLHLAGRPQFAACLPYVPFIAAAYVVRSQGDYLRMSLWVDRRVGLDASLNWAGALFCLAAYALLIPRWTLWGAIAATFLTFSFVLVIAYRKARQLREFRLEYQRLFLLSGLAVVLCGLAVGAKDEPATITLPLGLVLVAAYPLLLCMAGFWLPSERHAISVLYSRVRSTLGARTWRSRHLTRDTARQPEISAPSAR